MSKYHRLSRDAFKAEQARRAAYWEGHLEYAFSNTFSWTNDIYLSVYRKSYNTHQATQSFLIKETVHD